MRLEALFALAAGGRSWCDGHIGIIRGVGGHLQYPMSPTPERQTRPCDAQNRTNAILQAILSSIPHPRHYFQLPEFFYSQHCLQPQLCLSCLQSKLFQSSKIPSSFF